MHRNLRRSFASFYHIFATVQMVVNKRLFIQLGGIIQGRVRNEIPKRDFHSLFGVSPEVCFDMWKRCRIPASTGILPKHFLWALLFFKVYGSETVLCALAKASKKTFRKWIWNVIPRIAGMYPVLVSETQLCFRLLWFDTDALPSYLLVCFQWFRSVGVIGSEETKGGRAR